MARQSKPLEFLANSQTDPKLSAQIMKALEKGNSVTTKQIMQIAKKAGYAFSRKAFETSVKKKFGETFAGPVLPVSARRIVIEEAPESACSRGCLSYSVNWHPDPIFLDVRKKRPATK
jgi:hypothetical protein